MKFVLLIKSCTRAQYAPNTLTKNRKKKKYISAIAHLFNHMNTTSKNEISVSELIYYETAHVHLLRIK